MGTVRRGKLRNERYCTEFLNAKLGPFFVQNLGRTSSELP